MIVMRYDEQSSCQPFTIALRPARWGRVISNSTLLLSGFGFKRGPDRHEPSKASHERQEIDMLGK